MLFSGCAMSPPGAARCERDAAALRVQIQALGPNVSAHEAAAVADVAVRTSAALGERYRVVWPPYLHNNLVNVGLRERGLCYDWANDLFVELHHLRSQTLSLHLVVARMDTSREHNAVLITTTNQPLSDGLILDAWRRSGRLWWGTAGEDKYPWQFLPYERVNPELQKLNPQPGVRSH